MEKVKCDGCGQTYWLTSKSKWQHRECANRSRVEPVDVGLVEVKRQGFEEAVELGVVGSPEPGELESKPRKQRWAADKYRAYMKMHMAVTRAVKAGRAEWWRAKK